MGEDVCVCEFMTDILSCLALPFLFLRKRERETRKKKLR